MSFKEYISERVVKSDAEIQDKNDRIQAKELISGARGAVPGREIAKVVDDFEDDETNIAQPGRKADEEKTIMVLKNNMDELVYVDKNAVGDLYITIVNKRRMTKRTIGLDRMASSYLKRFI